MSQAKVDKYKDYKKNRRENIRKEKFRAKRNKVIAWLVVVAIIVGVAVAIGVSLYNSYRAKLAAMPTYGSTSFILSDNVGIRSAGDEDPEELQTEEAETNEAETEEAESEETATTEAVTEEPETEEPETEEAAETVEETTEAESETEE